MLGGMAQQFLGAGVFQVISRTLLVYGALTLGAAHFLAERSDGIKPAGYAALALAAAAIVAVATGATAV